MSKFRNFSRNKLALYFFNAAGTGVIVAGGLTYDAFMYKAMQQF